MDRLLVCFLLSSVAAPAIGAPPKSKRDQQRAADRKIAERAGLLDALRGDRRLDGLGTLGPGLSLGPNLGPANAHFEAQRFEKARAAYQKALPQERKCEGSFCARAASRGLARTCEELLDFDCARRAWRRVAEVPTSPLSMGFGGIGGRKRASPVERRLSALRALVDGRRRGRAAMASGDAAAAVVAFDAVVRADPECPHRSCSAVLLRDRGLALAAAGELTRAIADLERYLKVARKAPDRPAMRRRLRALQKDHREAVAAATADRRARQLRLDTGEPAPWLAEGDPPREIGVRRAWHGHDAALAQRTDGWFGYRRDGRVFGPLRMVSDVKWIGLGGDDRVYVATKDGRLRTSILEDLRTSMPEEVARLPDIDDWDVGGRTVVARDASRRTVHVSNDGGLSFHVHRFDAAVRSAHARFDDLAVVGAADGAWVSRDGGKTWKHTPLGDLRLQRSGGVIGRTAWRAEMFGRGPKTPPEAACAQGVLGADGETWRVPAGESLPRTASWGVVFTPRRIPTGATHMPTQAHPAPPSEGASALAEVEKCRADPDAWFERRGTGAIGGMGSRCRGLGCLGSPALSPGPVRFRFLGDGRCGALRAALTPRAPIVIERRSSWRTRDPASVCDPRALVELPTLQIQAKALDPTLRAGPPCAATEVWSLGGLGLVSCADTDGRTGLHVLDAGGEVRESVTFVGRLQHLSMAPDGTIAAQYVDDAGVHAQLRRPIALGAPAAWLDARLDGAVGWRPGPRGNGLALAAASKPRMISEVKSARRLPPKGLRLLGYGADKASRSIWSQCHQRLLDAEPDAVGTLVATVEVDDRGAVGGVQAEPGPLSAYPAFVECVFGGIRARRTPVRDAQRKPIAAKLTERITFAAHPTNFSVWQVGAEATRVADDVRFEAPPEEFAARSDGTVEMELRSKRGAPCLIPETGALLCPEDP